MELNTLPKTIWSASTFTRTNGRTTGSRFFTTRAEARTWAAAQRSADTGVRLYSYPVSREPTEG